MTIFEEILSLLSGSPELHAYLLARPEQLQTTDYADIITGAPIALTEKGRLLERLSEHMTHSEDAGLIRDYSACLKTALPGAGKQGSYIFGGALDGRRTA